MIMFISLMSLDYDLLFHFILVQIGICTTNFFSEYIFFNHMRKLNPWPDLLDLIDKCNQSDFCIQLFLLKEVN